MTRARSLGGTPARVAARDRAPTRKPSANNPTSRLSRHLSPPRSPFPLAELVVGNMCRRVLHIIREEAEHGRPGHGDADDASDDASGSDSDEGESLGKMKKFKSEVIEVIHELIDELESSSAHITSQALEHVSPSSVVLTSGGDELVEAFLREANRKRKFQAVVADGGASRGGHRLARALAEKGVETTAISDAAVFAMMSRVNIVVIAARGVFSNGGVLASAGDLNVAVAAKHHAVPVVVLAGTHELSPLGPGDPEFEMNDLLSPAEVLDYTALADCLPSAAGEGCGDGGTDEGAGRGAGGASLDVAHPAFDYVPPELVTLFLTDAGGQVPGFIPSLLGEIYSLPADRTF